MEGEIDVGGCCEGMGCGVDVVQLDRRVEGL
jgi:hypothetical protein